MVIGSAARPESDRVVELWEQALRASGDPAIERWYVGADESWSPSVPMPTGSAVRRLAIRNREVYRARCGIIGVPMSLLLTADGFVKLAVSGVPSLETLDEGIFLLGHLTDKSTSVRRGQPFDSLLAR
jgi:hypothetical protein